MRLRTRCQAAGKLVRLHGKHDAPIGGFALCPALRAARYEMAAKLMSLVKHAESDAWLALGLCFYLNVLPLTRQLTNLSGSLWAKALQVRIPQCSCGVAALSDIKRLTCLAADPGSCLLREARVCSAGTGCSRHAFGLTPKCRDGVAPLALQGQRAQRIEMLLLHEFHGRKFLLPDKLSMKVRLSACSH